MALTEAIEQHLTIPETAKITKMSPKTIWRKVLSKPPQLSSVKIGRSRRIPVSAVQEMLDRGRSEAA